MATEAPKAPSSRAQARPIPLPPPVISAIFSLKRPGAKIDWILLTQARLQQSWARGKNFSVDCVDALAAPADALQGLLVSTAD